MLRHPTFIAGNVRCYAQRKALLAQQRVAAIARAVGPNFASLGKVHDVLINIARPRHIALAWRQRLADTVHAGYNALFSLVDFFINRHADARHDAHVHHNIRRIGKLHADLGHGRIDRPHAERQHVHCAAFHGAIEKFFQFSTHGERRHPVISGPGVIFRQRADEGPIFDARDIVGIGAGIKAARP